MKKSILAAALAACLAAAVHAQSYVPSPENLQARREFSRNRFGIFLHWGLYSLFGQGEWYMTNADIDRREYAKAAQAFYPHRFDARAWVSAIKAAGARYVCFTTRHHEGFSMWDTKQSDYNVMNTPYGKDILRQLADECHRQGLGLHLYYSHIDWTREDYPAGRTGRGTGKRARPDWDGYYAFMNRQLTELLTDYGKVDAIWFDGVWDHDEDSVPFDWRLLGQYALVHGLQPACLIGNNHHGTPLEGEDIQIFERDVPGENKAGLSGQEVSRLPLETCQTMNGMWGYKVADQDYKTSAELVRLLVRTAAKGANLLLNIGPQPDGTLPDTALSRLRDMGAWLDRYGETVYGTEAGGVASGDSVVSTRRDGKLYLHCLRGGVAEVRVPVDGKVKRVADFAAGRPLKYRRQDGMLVVPVSVPRGVPDYVVEVTFR